MVSWKRIIGFSIIGFTIGAVSGSVLKLIIALLTIVPVVLFMEVLAVEKYKEKIRKSSRKGNIL